MSETVLILQNLSTHGPGHLGEWLRSEQIPFEVFDTAGQGCPRSIAGYRALALPHQAFALGRHLAMQFHVELDASKLAAWLAAVGPGHVRLQADFASVQSVATMRAQAAQALAPQQRFADRLDRRWLGLAP